MKQNENLKAINNADPLLFVPNPNWKENQMEYYSEIYYRSPGQRKKLYLGKVYRSPKRAKIKTYAAIDYKGNPILTLSSDAFSLLSAIELIAPKLAKQQLRKQNQKK